MADARNKDVMTVKKIAEMAGVSRAAVSAVLNDRWGTVRLNDRTRKKIEAILRKTSFRPNTVGKALVLGRSLTIGMTMSSVGFSFVPTLIQAVEDFTEKQGYGLLLMTTRDDPAREEQVLEFMLARNVEGIILGPCCRLSEKIRESLQKRNVPLVFLCQVPDVPVSGSVCVYGDGRQFGALGIRHLLERGHRHIACVGLMEPVKEGAREAAAEFAEPLRIEYWPFDWESHPVQATFDRWYKSDPRPTALFISGDEYACPIMNLAIQRGIRIPDQLALLGIDDLPMARQAAIPLSTVAQPKYEIGWTAVQILFDLLQGKTVQDVVYQPTLVQRETT